jgi:putative membrane protein
VVRGRGHPAPRAGAWRSERQVVLKSLSIGLTALVALSHLAFLVLEMFFWDHPIGREVFDLTTEQSAASAVLAKSQGLYNGFLAAGLGWGLWMDRRDVKLFFLGCIVAAGVFGALTAKLSILFVQAMPAAIALLATHFAAHRR